VRRTIGFDVTIVTSAKTDAEARELLTLLGVPFRKGGSSGGGQSDAGSPESTEAEAA